MNSQDKEEVRRSIFDALTSFSKTRCANRLLGLAQRVRS